MTPDEWLEKNNRKPYVDPDYDDSFWYWRSECNFNPDNGPEEWDFIVPDVVYDLMEERTTYPRVKMYDTEAAALADFRQAFVKALDGGWVP